MAKNITGSGGVDTSILQEIRQNLEQMLSTQKEINSIKVKPQGDDSGLKPVVKTLEEIREEARNTSRTNFELWNTKALKRNIKSSEQVLSDVLKNFDLSKISSENIGKFEKDFIKAFATMKAYSDRYGQTISQDIQKIYDAIFNKSDVFKQDDLSKLLRKNIEAANEEVKRSSFDIQYEANENWIRQQSEAYKEQARLAKESAKATQEAERKKRQELSATRDEITEGIKTTLESIVNSVGDNEMLNVDLKTWGTLQKQFGDLIQTMSEMGVEVKDIEKSFGDLSNKVYVPTDKINAVRDAMAQSSAEAQEMADDVNKISGSLSNIDDPKIIKLQEEIESWQQSYYQLYNRVHEMNAEMERMYSEGEFVDLAARTWEYESALERANQQLEELRRKYELLKDENEILIDENRDLQSTRDNVTSNISKVTKETEQASQETEVYENVSKEAFDSGKLSEYVNILAEIKKILQDISSALGAVDKSNSFSNVITNVDTLLSKLDEMYQKIGTGVYNIQVNQGVDKTAQENIAATSDYIKSTRSRYANAYQKVVDKAGGEERLFAYINNAIDFKGGIDQLYKAFGSSNISQIESAETQIYRYMDFFKILRQAISTGDFGLDLSRIKIPSNDDQNFRKQLKKKSGVNKASEDIIDLDNDKIDLSEIIEKLSEIKDLISNISKTDLFGNSLNGFADKLEEILRKFDTLVSKVKVVNDHPIETTDWSVEYEVRKTKERIDEVTESQKELNETLREQKEIINQTPDIQNVGKDKDDFGEGNIQGSVDNTINSTNAINNEAVAAENVSSAFSKASIAKDDFKTSNENVEKSAEKSSDALNQETEAAKKMSDLMSAVFQRTVTDINVGIQDLTRKLTDVGIYDSFSSELDIIQDRLNNIGNDDAGLKVLTNVFAELKKRATEAINEIKAVEKAEKDATNTDVKESAFDKNLAQTEANLLKLEQQLKDTGMIKKYQTEINNLFANLDTANIERSAELLTEINNAIKVIDVYSKSGRAINQDEISDLVELINKQNELYEIEKQIAILGNKDSEIYSERIKYLNEQREILKNIVSQIDSTGILNDNENAEIYALSVLEKRLQYEEAIALIRKQSNQEEDRNSRKAQSDYLAQTNLLKQINSWISKNSIAYKEYKDELDILINRLSSGAAITKEELNDIRISFGQIQTEATKAGKTGASLVDIIKQRWKSLAAYVASFVQFYDIVRYTRQAFTTIQELDYQLVDLRKTTTMTASELDEFYSTSARIAKQLGVTTSEIISQASAWSRLGYSTKEEATQMAQLSSQFATVSPGMTTEQSTDYLVSTMQAYGIAVDDVERKIMDNVNRIGKIFAETYGNIWG